MNNLVQNGGFDNSNSSIAPWTRGGVFTASVQTGVYYNGTQANGGPTLSVSPNNSGRITFPIVGLGLGYLEQLNIPLIPGAEYIVSFAIRTSGAVNLSIINVEIPNTTFTGIDVQLGLLSLNTWNTYQSKFYATGNQTKIRFSSVLVSLLGAINIDAVSIVQIAAPCFSWQSIIRTKHILTGEIQDLLARDVYSDEHLVLCTDTNTFIPIIYNAKTGTTKRYRMFPANVYGPGKPVKDFYVTSGHRMIVDGLNVKAGKLKEGILTKVSDDPIYTICTEKACPIWINGLDVMTYEKQEFLDYVTKKTIAWKDNKKRYDDETLTEKQNNTVFV